MFDPEQWVRGLAFHFFLSAMFAIRLVAHNFLLAYPVCKLNHDSRRERRADRRRRRRNRNPRERR